MSRDEEVIRRRGFPEITDDNELIEKAKELTNNWLGRSGQGHTSFIGYYFGDYYSDEPFQSFTSSEFKRIKQLQEIEREKYDSLYGWENYRGKPLSEEAIIRFLDRHIEQEAKHWGIDSFYHKGAITHKENTLKKWREGEVVVVDSDCDSYNDRWLYSDGTIHEQHWGD